MKLNITFPELIAQQRKIGASECTWNLDTEELDPRTKHIMELERGIEISLRDVERQPGGLLAHKGEQVILYIKDTGDSFEKLKNEPESSRKFHLFNCKTLVKMEMEGRFERYVVTRKTDGNFLVFWRDPYTNEHGETKARLNVCKNCLYSLNWKGYSKRLKMRDARDAIVKEFSIEEFFREYATFFQKLPKESDITALPNDYVKDWSNISRGYKEKAGWVCSSCTVVLEKRQLRKHLHCHHISGKRRDNSGQNIEVLCALCHRDQFLHQRMKVSDDTKREIIEQRMQQGLP